ncbi:amidohydrolase family protein [Falsiroseomonas sp. HW251]|uniref:amidohydrolase family protein n=1 Tax=Falsiroseomonas sp. HW251 TaxID=3390998 RepID=UPI003D30F115
MSTVLAAGSLAFGGRLAGAVDCDIHAGVPRVQALYPYLPDYWRDFMRDSENPNLEPNTWPANSPLSARPGSRAAQEPAGSDPALLRTQVLDATGARCAIVNCPYGIAALRNEYWAAAMATALNDWMAAEWLAGEARLLGSIVVAPQSPEAAVKEIERLAPDPRFVQVLLPARTEMPLGRRHYWPIFEAAERHGLPVCIHAGGGAGNPTMPVGWAYYYVEDYAAHAQAAQTQLVSLVSEGVFSKFPRLRLVFAECGWTWLPSLAWRFDKNWKGLRREIPWVDRLPSAIIREHCRFTLQPVDAPDEPRHLLETFDMAGGEDLLLFSSDWPHWHDDAEDPLPAGLSPEAERKLLVTNAEGIYRLP